MGVGHGRVAGVVCRRDTVALTMTSWWTQLTPEAGNSRSARARPARYSSSCMRAKVDAKRSRSSVSARSRLLAHRLLERDHAH